MLTSARVHRPRLHVAALDAQQQAIGRLPAWTLGLTALPVALTSVVAGLLQVHRGGDGSRLLYSTSCVIALAVLALVARTYRLTRASFGWQVVRRGDIGCAVAGALAGGFVAYPIAVGINAALGTPMNESLLRPSSGLPGYALQFVFAVVVAPLAEETLFRGLALTWLRARGLGPVVATAISLAGFAVIHLPAFGIGGVVFITLWGVVPSTLYLLRGSITSSWLAHVLNNTSAYFLVA